MISENHLNLKTKARSASDHKHKFHRRMGDQIEVRVKTLWHNSEELKAVIRIATVLYRSH